ncbi:unnamed protein product [Plutella xylostella]|uniref:(diamondback moth) hypothetical protein n=1 Tax=Plutella xylostella TaxID=51655 RepID=A0A8S4FSI0_PLUXY|nr:unnamed protein product [Plutella xylostella]
MNILLRSLKRCTVVTFGNRFVYNVQPTENLLKLIVNIPASAWIIPHNTVTTMAQRSITSFFTKTPKKSIDKDSSLDSEASPSAKDTPPSSKTSTSEDTATTNSKTPVKKSVKRRRLESSGSESRSPQKSSPEPSPVKETKKKVKRQRIESSSSEQSQSPKKIPKEEKPSPIVEKKKSPKTYSSPKSKKVNVKEEKVPLVERNGKADKSKDNPKQKKEKDEVKSEVVKVEIELEVAKENKIKEEVTESKKVEETEYNPAKAKYHPIRDACWSEGQPVPYLALAKTLEAIEGTSARLKMIEILSNYFRSVMVLTPEDLLPSVYMCLNQLAPAYHSLELGIAETYLMKAIGQCTGRTLAQVKAAAQKSGDLGLVAEQARATQRTMFQSKPLEARKVFQALKDVAHMTGQASVNKKIGKIQSLYVACRNAEARYLIR